jgi:hypothetical protein
MASRLVLQRFNPDAPTLSRAVQNALRSGESREVAIDSDRRNGGRGSGGLRARGLEPSGEPGMRHVEEGGNWR